MVSVTKRETPALRFGKYSQPWVEAKNNRIFAPTDERGFAGLPVLSATQKDGFIPRSMLGKEISYNKDAEKTYKRVLPDDFAIHLRSFQGGFAHSKYEGITSPAYTTFRLRQVSQHNGLFWKNLFTSPSFIQSLTKVTYGIRDGRSIGADEYFLEDSCFPPSLEEQRAIGELFADLDALIEQHRAKHANLQQTKTALLQRMFPRDGADAPELRLDGFSGAWDEAQIKNVSDILVGNPFQSSSFVDEGVRLVRGANVKRGWLDFDPSLTVFWPSIRGVETFLLDENDILLQMDGALIGKSFAMVSKTNLPALLVQRVARVRAHHNVDPKLLYQWFVKDFFGYIRSVKTETAVPHLSALDILSFRVKIPPTIEEQRAVGEVFSNLDALIAAEASYITQLTQAKTALLQRMFV